METKLLITNLIAVVILLSPQEILNLPSVKTIQSTAKAAAPWFQIAAASLTIFKEVSTFCAKKNKTGNSKEN